MQTRWWLTRWRRLRRADDLGLALSERGGRGASIENRDYGHCVVFSVERIDDDHPAPGPKNEPVAFPPTPELTSDKRESLQNTKQSDHALFGVVWQTKYCDLPVQVVRRRRGDHHASHVLQVFQENDVSVLDLSQPSLCGL